jgi:hypothetical protein
MNDAPRLRLYPAAEVLEAVAKVNVEFGLEGDAALRWSEFGGLLGAAKRIRGVPALAVTLAHAEDGLDPLDLRAGDTFEAMTAAARRDLGLERDDLVRMRAIRALRDRVRTLELDSCSLPES